MIGKRTKLSRIRMAMKNVRVMKEKLRDELGQCDKTRNDLVRDLPVLMLPNRQGEGVAYTTPEGKISIHVECLDDEECLQMAAWLIDMAGARDDEFALQEKAVFGLLPGPNGAHQGDT